MRNTPLKAFARKSPLTSNPSVSDSVRRGNIRPVEIVEKKKETYDPGKTAPKPGKLIDTTKRNRDRMMAGNPLATLFVGRKPKKS